MNIDLNATNSSKTGKSIIIYTNKSMWCFSIELNLLKKMAIYITISKMRAWYFSLDILFLSIGRIPTRHNRYKYIKDVAKGNGLTMGEFRKLSQEEIGGMISRADKKKSEGDKINEMYANRIK